MLLANKLWKPTHHRALLPNVLGAGAEGRGRENRAQFCHHSSEIGG